MEPDTLFDPTFLHPSPESFGASRRPTNFEPGGLHRAPAKFEASLGVGPVAAFVFMAALGLSSITNDGWPPMGHPSGNESPTTSEISCAAPWLPEMLNMAEGLTHLHDGWDGRQSEAPTATAHNLAVQVLHRLAIAGMAPDRVIASAHGGIAAYIVATAGARFASLGCYNTGDVVAILRDPSHNTSSVVEVDASSDAIDGAIVLIQAFFGA